MNESDELKETEGLRALYQNEMVLTQELVNLAGRAADEIAQLIGPRKGTFDGQRPITVTGVGMLFVEEYDTPIGKQRILKYIPRTDPVERWKHIGYITHRFKPGEKYIIGPNTVLLGAASDVYVRFAQKIDKVVEKAAEIKSQQVSEVQKALTHIKNYLLEEVPK